MPSHGDTGCRIGAHEARPRTGRPPGAPVPCGTERISVFEGRVLGLTRLFLAIVAAGSLVGLVGALFLAMLRSADTARIALISLADGSAFPSWLAGLLFCLVAASLAAWLASRFAPDAPQTAEANSDEPAERPTSVFAALSVNFAGTGLAIDPGHIPSSPPKERSTSVHRPAWRAAAEPLDRPQHVRV